MTTPTDTWAPGPDRVSQPRWLDAALVHRIRLDSGRLIAALRYLHACRGLFSNEGSLTTGQQLDLSVSYESRVRPIHYCALGVAMTEPVEGWIRRAGEACVRAGFDKLGRALQGHARAEAGHHLLMIADLDRLCDRCAAAGRVAPKPGDMLALQWPESTQRYRQMHEDVIAGPHPYAQIAIENEIEMLSVDVGPRLLDNARSLLGDDILDDLSFLTDHVTLDIGHTKFNRRQMAAFLDMQAEQGRVDGVLDALVVAGSEVLDAYRAFVSDCVSMSSRGSRVMAT